MRRFISVLFLSLFATLTGWSEDLDYYVESWDYLAVVHDDNTWDIRERIEVNFLAPHHGIFLYKPRLFSDYHQYEGQEAQYYYRLSIENVKVSGYNFNTEATDDSQFNYIIQIGDEDVTLTGLQTYIVRYTIVYSDDRIKDADFIYHSVLGDGWPSDIRHFSYELRFDKALPQAAIDSCFIISGRWNSLNDDLNVASSSYIDKYSLSGEVENIAGNQAISIKMTLPEGYFTDVHTFTPWLPYLCYFTIIVLALIMLWRLSYQRIDRPVQSVEFYPPDGLTGAEVGTIIDNSADVSDLVALIPWYAQHGYIEIEEQPGKHKWSKSQIILHRINPLPEDSPAYQREFLSALFPEGDETVLSELGDRHVLIESARKHLENEFKKDRTLTTSSLYYLLLPCMLVLELVGYASDTQFTFFDSDQFYIGLFIMILQGFAAWFRMSYADIRAFRKGRTWLSVFAVFLLGTAHAGFFIISYEPQNLALPLWLTLTATVLCYIAMLFSDRFFLDTPYRLQLIGKLLGLREFIKTAEKDRLEMLVDEQPSYFYSILPYAMVFGLSERWAAKFKDIDMPQPSWYHSSDISGISSLSGSQFAQTFSRSISTSVASAVASSSHDPSSSSGGSGGGGGGGGGGAW